MTDEQYEQAYELISRVDATLRLTVDQMLKDQLPEVEDFVRLKLTEDMRFWK